MSKFSFFLATPPIKLKVEPNIHGVLLIANHLDQSRWWTNQKYWTAVRCNLLHSFWEVHNCVAPFYQPRKLHEFGAEKPIFWDGPAHFNFFTIYFTVWSHILSTVGNARTTLLFAAVRILGTYYSTCSLLIAFILPKHSQIFLVYLEDKWSNGICFQQMCF